MRSKCRYASYPPSPFCLFSPPAGCGFMSFCLQGPVEFSSWRGGGTVKFLLLLEGRVDSL